ncbi:MAG: hypothetical protein HQL64_09590 [Magnetococcales bacterium]|nr:hypothetical protein [Magnetococcales bacterium]
MNKRTHLSLLLLLSAYGGGCGGGDGGGGVATSLSAVTSTTSPTPSIGYFVDAPVSGLAYTTPTLSGKTDDRGAYSFVAGEIVTFKVGDVVLGSALGTTTPISPLTLGGSGATQSTQSVKNIAVFLQSLDPGKGTGSVVAIPDAAHAQLTAKTAPANTGVITNLLADFKVGSSSSSFTSDLSNLLAVVAPGATPVKEADAISQMTTCLAKRGISAYAGSYSSASKDWSMIVSGFNNFMIVLSDGSVKTGQVDNKGALSIPNLDKSTTTPTDTSLTGAIGADGTVKMSWKPATTSSTTASSASSSTSTTSTTASTSTQTTATAVTLSGNNFSSGGVSSYAGEYSGLSTSVLKGPGGSTITGSWMMKVDGNNNFITSYHGDSSVVSSYLGAAGTLDSDGKFRVVGTSGSVTGSITADGKVSGLEYNSAGVNVYTFSGQKENTTVASCP